MTEDDINDKIDAISDKLENIELTLCTLISWSGQTLGEIGCKQLFDIMDNGISDKDKEN